MWYVTVFKHKELAPQCPAAKPQLAGIRLQEEQCSSQLTRRQAPNFTLSKDHVVYNKEQRRKLSVIMWFTKLLACVRSICVCAAICICSCWVLYVAQL